VATGAARGRVPVLVRAADVDPVDVRFLWRPYLPLGKLTLLEGDPSAGKTWLALSLATAVSLGAPFPAVEGLPRDVRPPADVIYLTAEDGIDDTLRPRLDRMGADVRRVHFLMGWKRGMVGGQITLQDLDVLGAALRQVRPALVVVDPVQAFLGAEVDMHRANEVRPVLTGLVKLAEEHACAVVAIRHLSKAPATKAMFRGLGSIDFTAAARSVLLAGKDPGSGDRAMCHVKASVAREGPAQGYTITDEEGCSWTGASHLTAQDLVAAEKPSRERGGSVDDAVAFLADALAAGPRPAAEVERDADGAGVSTATLKRAKGQLRVESYRSNARGQGRGRGAWMWALPGAQDPDAASYDDEH
ncbi:MAG: AAA family ATPase, partial [Planctomycetota bacterium]|nr:AAA family ATPase [Planctomycetota bacterium]